MRVTEANSSPSFNFNRDASVATSSRLTEPHQKFNRLCQCAPIIRKHLENIMLPTSDNRKQWLDDTRLTLAITLSLSVFSGVMLSHFYGAGMALGWTIAMLGTDTALHVFLGRNDEATVLDDRHYLVCAAGVVAGWLAAALLFWMTGSREGWAWAIVVIFGLIVHIIFNLARRPELQRAFLAGPFVVLLGCLLWSAWASYPLVIAIAGTLSVFGSLLGIASASRTASHTFQRLIAALNQVQADRERLEFAIESAGDGYFEIDFSSMTYRPNPKFAIALGFDPSDKGMTTLRDRVHSDDAPEAFARLEECVRRERAGWNQDLRVRIATGGYRWMHLRARVIGQKLSRGLVATVVDLSDRKALEADLRAAKDAAEASSRSKGEFLANMSHEIRTPLNGVLGMAQSLANDDLAPAQREKVATILESGRSLTVLLNDVLDLSKVEAGKLEISAIPGDLRKTIHATQQLFQTTAQQKGLELLVLADTHLPRHLNFDPVRVRQCLGNLISNAIKFTENGRVEICVSSSMAGEGSHLVRVVVQDTGIGMSADVQAKLFAAFTQADGATTRKFGGTGLGLAISRHLARLMSGDIVVTSQEGIGSTFVMTFCAETVEMASQADAAPAEAALLEGGSTASLRGKRVLVTDDNAINRQVIKLFLAALGLDIVEAANGREALDQLAAQPIDLVLLDVHMPVMDGREAIQRIRAAGEPWSGLPVIALTADAMSGDREKYLALGMNDYLSKPVDQHDLIAKIRQALKLDDPVWRHASGRRS